MDTGHGGHDLNIPYDNLLTEEGVALGRRLFYETALSDDCSMICASRQNKENQFSNPRAESVCTHGDSPGAVQTARRVRAVLAAAGVEVRAFA